MNRLGTILICQLLLPAIVLGMVSAAGFYWWFSELGIYNQKKNKYAEKTAAEEFLGTRKAETDRARAFMQSEKQACSPGFRGRMAAFLMDCMNASPGAVRVPYVNPSDYTGSGGGAKIMVEARSKPLVELLASFRTNFPHHVVVKVAGEPAAQDARNPVPEADRYPRWEIQIDPIYTDKEQPKSAKPESAKGGGR